MEPFLWTFRDENDVIHALCLVYVDDFMLTCSDSPLGKYVFENIINLCEWRTWESRMFTQCGARITQANDKRTRTWCGFEIIFTENAKEISLITLPSHRRRNRKSQFTPLELSQLRALNGQSVALVGYAMFANARQIPASLVVDCRGVYDALARSSSPCLGLKDKKSCLEALALKQSLVECGSLIRWCHSPAQV